MTLNNEIQAIHDLLRKLTNLEHYIKEENFIKFFLDLSEKDRNYVLTLIKTYKYVELKNYVKNYHARSVNSMNVRDLRFLGSQYKIHNYGSLSKNDLRVAIHDFLAREKNNGET